MTKKLTIEEIYKYCKDNNYDLPIINQEYYNSRTPIEFVCDKHGNYYQNWNSHKRGSTGCKLCRYDKTSKSNRLSWESLVNSCKSKGYDIPLNKNEYKNQNSLMTFNCPKHGKYKQSLCSHMQGKTGCKKCEFNKRHSNNLEWNMKKMYDYCKEHNLDLPKEGQKYKNNSTKYTYICPKHGEYSQSWEKHRNGQISCKQCSINNTLLNLNNLNNQCNTQKLDIAINTFNNSGRFYGIFICKVHNIKYRQRIDMHLRGQGCPVCKESHGEKYIRNYLDEHNIKYEPQKRFKDLKDKKLLSYDFYLPKYNILIEYQGIQHYESISFNNKDKTDLEKQQLHDKLKREYAKNNGYKLLELHYSLDTQEKVNKYLTRRIKG